MRQRMLLLWLLAPCAVAADDLDNVAGLDQQEFRLLAEDLGAVTAFRSTQTAEPQGSIGYSIDAGVSMVRLANADAWRQAGSDASSVTLARIGVSRGLPMDFDVGAYLASAPGSGLRVYGAQLRYALLEGGISSPAVGLRAAVTRASGIRALEHETRGVEIAVSQRFGSITPYAGAGRQWAMARPDAGTGLETERVAATRGFAGVRMTSLVMRLTLEAETIGDATGYAASIGFFF